LLKTQRDGKIHLKKLRGKNYFIGSSTDIQAYNCFITRWEISHFIFHTFLGYYYNIYISQGISIGWEIYEHKVYDAGSLLDFIWNLGGFLFGSWLRPKK
jgi:hypothetical protein